MVDWVAVFGEICMRGLPKSQKVIVLLHFVRRTNESKKLPTQNQKSERVE